MDRFIASLTRPEWILIVVWTGLAVLTAALIVLMRTRWGQEKPLRKCIVLSLMAHLLFAAYATTITVVSAHRRQGDGAAMRIAAIDDIEFDDAPHEGRREAKPWEESNSAPIEPDVAELAPAATDADANDTHDISPFAEPALADAPIELNQRPVAERPLADASTPRETPSPAEQIEVAPAEQQAAPQVAPEHEALARPTDTAESEATNAASAADIARLVTDSLVPTLSPLLPNKGDEGFVAPDAATSGSSSPDGSSEPIGALVPARQPEPSTSGGGQASPSLVGASGGAGSPPDLYRARTEASRLRLVESFGGSAETEAAVNAALQWLARHQAGDGHWDGKQTGAGRETHTLGKDRGGAGARADTGLTGLALLAFLGSGNTHQHGTHADTVKRGINYLIAVQAHDGNLAGQAEVYAFMYCHGMATLALSEAYAMTKDPRLEQPLRRAIGYTLSAQNQSSGGWRYKPWRESPTDRGDTSQLGWQLMALKSADLAGIGMPERTRQGMVRFLNSVSSGPHGGLASYRTDERATAPMTAEALVCRQFLELAIGDARDDATSMLLAEPPGTGQRNFYYWYYGTLGMFQLQGEAWTQWNSAMTRELLRTQRTDSDAAGSWEPDELWGGYGGRVFSTSLGALCLEVYYRYLPLYTTTASRLKEAR